MLKAGKFWIRFWILITWNADQELCFLRVWQLSVQVIVSGRAVPQQRALDAWNHLTTFKSRLKMYCFPHTKKSSVVFLRNVMCFWPQFRFTFLGFGEHCKIDTFYRRFSVFVLLGFFYNSYKYSINYCLTRIINCEVLWSMELSCTINFSMIRTISSIPHLSSIQRDLKCMHQLKL